MNPAQTKLVTWTAAGALGVGLCVYVGYHVPRLEEIRAPVSKERMTQVLSNTREIVQKADDFVPYDQVRSALISFDWPGAPPAPEAEDIPRPEPPRATELPVAKLVQVLGYSVDAAVPENSKAILEYLPEAKVPPPPATATVGHVGVLKFPGDSLDPPIAHIRVHSITVAGVEFAFGDAEREHEVLLPKDFPLDSRFVRVDPSEVVTAPKGIPIPLARSWAPATQTQQLGRNKYRIGTEDAAYIEENFAAILSEEVRTSRHRDPRTGKYDGIEVRSVAAGSIAERHGAQAGDVIKSINGQAVTSTQEAINFVKNNQDMYDRWEIVIENMGRERTVTYLPPQE